MVTVVCSNQMPARSFPGGSSQVPGLYTEDCEDNSRQCEDYKADLLRGQFQTMRGQGRSSARTIPDNARTRPIFCEDNARTRSLLRLPDCCAVGAQPRPDESRAHLQTDEETMFALVPSPTSRPTRKQCSLPTPTRTRYTGLNERK